MTLSEFCDYHRPALEAQEAKHNLMLFILGKAMGDKSSKVLTWSLGQPGACAIKMPDRAIVLGDLSEAQCHALAEETQELRYAAVFGPDLTAKWFAARAEALGLALEAPMPQRILTLQSPPRHPDVAGQAWLVDPEDSELLADWLTAFDREAIPEDPPRPRDRLLALAGSGDYLFWVVDGAPVSLAGIVRRTRRVGAIAAVYTPPEHRGRGYAGAVTAAVAERVFAEGRETACLYADLRNPAANRAYAKIGFQPLCESWFFARKLS